MIETDFLSVLGQTIFLDGVDSRFSVGEVVAVYGSIDIDTGGIVGATLVRANEAGLAANGASYLTGIVDSVDYSTGNAVVSGVLVDYNALLSTGWAPSVGDEVSVTGYHYRDQGMMVADPHLRF